MEINRCYGCMEETSFYPCPRCGYNPAANRNSFALRPGRILNGKYLIGKVLGQGGFGITYIGWDLALDRKVAIKEYYPSAYVSRQMDTGRLAWHTTDAARAAMTDGRDMFLKEARKMSRVSGLPQVVQVLDLFQENGTAYIAMEYVEGETLKSRMLRTGPLSWEEAKAIFLPVLESLEQVHAAGLIHRDLSPDNLMIQPNGRVKILDLGAAKDLSINSGDSSMLVAKGGFSPLEQYAQRGGSGTWTDVYAIAATMYFAMTGVVPPSAVERIDEDALSWEHPRLRALPPTAIQAMKNALIVRHGQRTQTMGDFARELKKEPVKKPVQSVRDPKPVAEAKTAEKSKKKEINILKLAIPVVCVIVLAIVLSVLLPAGGGEDGAAYKKAEKLLDKGETANAAIAFGKLGDYSDARERSFELWSQVAPHNTVSADSHIAAAVKSNGTVLSSEESVSGWTDIVSVAVEYNTFVGSHVVGLKSTGKVVAAGNNSWGQCDVSDWTDIVAVDTAYDQTVGLRCDGTVLFAGNNDDGECDVSGWTDIIAVSVGSSHIVGLKADGTVVAVGSNDDGQCNVSGWRNIVLISAGSDLTVGLKADGTVVHTGEKMKECESWTDLAAVYVGYPHMVGLKSDGTLVAAGGNSNGECEVSDWSDIVAISVGSHMTVGLKSDGTLLATGYNESGLCDTVSGWTDIRLPGEGVQKNGNPGYGTEETADPPPTAETDDLRQYDEGETPVLERTPKEAYKEAENLLAAGKTAEAAIAFGKLGDYSDARERSLKLWKQIDSYNTISAGTRNTIGVKTNGTVLAVGQTTDGQCNVSNWTDIVSVSAGGCYQAGFFNAGLKANGTVVVAGADYMGMDEPFTWTDIIAVGAGGYCTVGLKSDGTVVSRGKWDVSGWRNIVAISTGWQNTVGLKADGTVVAVGENDDGQCDVSGWKNIAAVSAGSYHTVGLKDDGTVVAVGRNNSGQCKVSDWTDIVAIAAGDTHTVALKNDGTVVATGPNDEGQCDVSGWTDIVAVSAGYKFTVGLKSDGTMVSTGQNNYGNRDLSEWKNIKIPG